MVCDGKAVLIASAAEPAPPATATTTAAARVGRGGPHCSGRRSHADAAYPAKAGASVSMQAPAPTRTPRPTATPTRAKAIVGGAARVKPTATKTPPRVAVAPTVAAPPLALPAGFAGTWDTNYGALALDVQGSAATGTYEWKDGQITGELSPDGRTLTGTWSQAPTHLPPRDAGQIVLQLAEDGRSFTGEWGHGDRLTDGAWAGRGRDHRRGATATSPDAPRRPDRAADLGLARPATIAPPRPLIRPSHRPPPPWTRRACRGERYELLVQRLDVATERRSGWRAARSGSRSCSRPPSRRRASRSFPATRFRWRPGPRFEWQDGECRVNLRYATCTADLEFAYPEPGRYEVRVEINYPTRSPNDVTNNDPAWVIDIGATPASSAGGARPVPGAITVFFTVRNGRPWGYVVDKQGREYRPQSGGLSVKGPNPDPGDRIVLQTDTPRFSLLFDCSTTPGAYSPCDVWAVTPGELPEIQVNGKDQFATLNISGPDNWAGERQGFAPRRYPGDPVLRIFFGSTY